MRAGADGGTMSTIRPLVSRCSWTNERAASLQWNTHTLTLKLGERVDKPVAVIPKGLPSCGP